MKFSCATILGAVVLAYATPAAVVAFVPTTRTSSTNNYATSCGRLFSATTDEELGLTAELKRITDAFANIGDEQVRYKQLLYMASNTDKANNMPDSSKIPENKVPGCLSTVYVDGTATYSDEAKDYVIDFIGDSDGLLTRGLVALLVRYVYVALILGKRIFPSYYQCFRFIFFRKS